MKNFFIFKYDDVNTSGEKIKVAVIFVHQEIIPNQNILSDEINQFFQRNSITDKLVILIPQYLHSDSKKFFFEDREKTFVRIPGRSKEYFDENLIIGTYTLKGGVSIEQGRIPDNEEKFIENIFRNGNTIIFKKNGGIVESTPDHHFVFPSNKHCSKFLRTGNVLVNQTEVFFIAIQFLKYFNDLKAVYCDTSSINSLPYAVLELKRRFNDKFISPSIFSFKSYELFESHQERFPHDSLILISSSTSGNIIDRLLKERRAEKNQIKVIYFLGKEENYLDKKENIICNLTKDEKFFPEGEEIFETYSNSGNCKLCENNSRPVNIRGDVFLTVQPKVYKHILTVKSECIPNNISPFVKNFRGMGSDETIIKTYHKDNDANSNYEVYFDFINLIDNIESYGSYKESLNRLIHKHVPANTKYFIHLPDEGSVKLSNYIQENIPDAINPTIVQLEKDFISNFDEDVEGSVLVVASCITTGKKFLQISRLMRKFEKLNLIYIVGIFRPVNESFASDLINDLKKGKDKSDERPFVPIETIYTSISQKNSTWSQEITFIEKLLSELDEETNLYKFFDERMNILMKNKSTRGLSNDLFLNQYNGTPLTLRKSFAFWKFNYEENEISQSEVYFTISSIINNLENRDINCHPSLKQTNYVRNLLSPRNFHRFNDGIIQSCLLRTAKPDYLSFDLDVESNLQMKEFLLTIINKYDSEDGEALLEFLLAIGLKKLKLKIEDLLEVLFKAGECEDEIISSFAKYLTHLVKN